MENRDIRGFFAYMRCSIEAVRGEYIIRREMREAAAERSFPRSEKGGFWKPLKGLIHKAHVSRQAGLTSFTLGAPAVSKTANTFYRKRAALSRTFFA